MTTRHLLVQRVETKRGSWVMPPLIQAWPRLRKLRWHLAVALSDAGAPPDLASVERGHVTVNGRPVEAYDVRYRRGTWGVGDFDDAWSFINGLGLGLRLTRQDVDQ